MLTKLGGSNSYRADGPSEPFIPETCQVTGEWHSKRDDDTLEAYCSRVRIVSFAGGEVIGRINNEASTHVRTRLRYGAR